MKAVIAAVAVSLTAGYAIGIGFGGEEETTAENPLDTAAYIDSTAPIEERLAALERIIAEERNARLVLEDQLGMVFEELDEFDGEISRGGPAEEPAVAQRFSGPVVINAVPPEFDSRGEYIVSQLVDGGFAPDRANWIVERTEEYRWEMMQARYDATQSGESVDWTTLNPWSRLRAELGDSEYERYLEATGQPTAVPVQSVMATSPASRAGLQPGDEIRSYNGQRVFNMGHLHRATMGAAPGTDVVVEIMRDGTPITLSLPAGPIGVSTGLWERVPGRRGN